MSQQGRTTGSLTSLERELFANSAVSYKFWTDSIEDEDREQLRLAVSEMEELAARKRRWGIGATVAALAAVALLIVTFQHGLQDTGMHTGETNDFDGDKYTQVFGLFLLTLFVGAFSLGNFGRWRTRSRSLKHPVSLRLQANSEERFNIWLAELETDDPDHHAEIVEWFRQVEWARQEKARIERERQAALRARSSSESLDPWGPGGIFDPKAGQMRAERANAWTSNLNPTPESYPQQQEQARQAAYQPSQNASRSEPTCYICGMPGSASTASGWMCGLHAHGLL